MVKTLLRLYSWKLKPDPSPQDLLLLDIEAALVDLDREILNKELALIDRRFEIEAKKAKKDFMILWMSRPTPKNE